MTSREVRAEQAIAFGRSVGWMVEHGFSLDDINAAHARMNAAIADDEAAYLCAASELVDEREALIASIVAGRVRIPVRVISTELTEAIRRMAADGLSDVEIAKRTYRSREAIRGYRKRHGIASGVEPCRRGSGLHRLWNKAPRRAS